MCKVIKHPQVTHSLRTLNYERAIVLEEFAIGLYVRLRTLNYERAIVHNKHALRNSRSLRTLNYERAIVLEI